MKHLLKNLLVPVLASRPVSALLENFVRPGIPIFMFHRFDSPGDAVSGHNIDYIHDCLNYLKKHNYHFVSIEDVINSINNKTSLPKRSVAFTIDDGFLDHATIAAPIFIEHQCPVTIFLISGLLDGELWPWDDQIAYLVNNTEQQQIAIELNDVHKKFSLNNGKNRKNSISDIQNWVKQLDGTHIEQYLNIISGACEVELPKQAPANYQPMSWDQARELEQRGVQFAPHTRTHRILSRLDDDESNAEITHSWQRLQEELSSPSPVFCYPTGRKSDYTQREIDNIKRAGLIGAVATEPTFIDLRNHDTDYLFKLPRFGFPSAFLDFIQYSSWIERAK